MPVTVRVVSQLLGERVPLVLDEAGFPLAGPNEWLLSRRHLSANTLMRNARELALFENWLSENSIDLDARLCSHRLFTEAELRGGLIGSLRLAKQSVCLTGATEKVRPIEHGKMMLPTPISDENFNNRLRTIHSYLSWRFTVEVGRLASSDAIFLRVKRHSELVDTIFSNSYVAKSPESIGMDKALSDKQLTDFKRLISYKNPVSYGHSAAVKFRNYICSYIMLMYGLRPGELLSLRVEDIVFGGISELRVCRRLVDPLDSRLPRPSVKRAGRQLPIDNPVFARELNEYITTHREKFMENGNARDHNYLIVSDEGDPLHLNSLSQYYRIIRDEFPEELPKNLTSKMLRHTFSVQIERMMAANGIPEQQRVAALMYWRGDTSPESQRVYTDAEMIRQSNKLLNEYHHELVIPDF